MKTSYLCPCGWSGHFPNVLKKEEHNGIVTRIYFESYCPDCDTELKPKNVVKTT
jgi:hypothetical protein